MRHSSRKRFQQAGDVGVGAPPSPNLRRVSMRNFAFPPMGRPKRRSGLALCTAAVMLVLAVVGAMLTGVVHGTASPAFAAATAGCGKAPTLTSGPRSIQSGGQNRSYILRIPDGYDQNHPYRLFFGFHWNGGTANDVDSGGSDGAVW